MTVLVRRNPTTALTLVEPFYQPEDFIDEIEDLAEQMWDVWQPVAVSNESCFDIDMYEEKDELVVKAELPGVNKQDIDIQLEGNSLSISAEKKSEMPEDATTYNDERSYGKFSRCLSLPFPVDTNKVNSTFENGILEIRLPKTEEAKAKHIEIKVK